jgi:multisubunit Na+/H+ antiporter MnhG subunit
VEIMNSTVEAGGAVGSILPLLQAVIQRPQWSANTKKRLVVVMSIIAGIATVAVHGDLSNGKLTLATILAVLTASQTAHALILKEAAARLEERTSPAPLE